MSDLAPGLPYRLFTDIRLTRRKYYHALFGPDNQPMFKSRLLQDVIDFAYAEGITRLELHPSQHSVISRHLTAILTLE